MATLYITEIHDLANANGGKDTQAPIVGSGTTVVEQKVTIGGASAQSAAFAPSTHFIMVHSDAICSLAFGTNPTALATAHRMAANETRFYGVAKGDKLAVITNT